MTPVSWLRWGVRLLVVLLVVLLAVPVVTATRVWMVSRQDERGPADVVLVLGAAQFDGEPSPVLESRLMHARTLYGEAVAPKVMTLGGKLPGDRFTEAAAGEGWLVDEGVPDRDVLAVPRGEDTLTSLRAAAQEMRKLGMSTAVVVTDPDHALRAGTMARDLGIDASVSPARYNTSRARSENGVRYILRETGAYLDYLLLRRRNVEPVL